MRNFIGNSGAFVWAVLLFAFCLEVSAEVRRSGFSRRGRVSVQVPIYAGYSLSGHSTHGGTKTVSSATGLAFGMGLRLALRPPFSVELDVLYVSKGYDSTQGSQIINWNVHYLEFPLLFQWSPTSGLGFRFGPYLASLVVSAEKNANGDITPVKSQFNNDFGVVFSFLGSVPIGKNMRLGIDLRYDIGMRDVENDHRPEDLVKTRTLMIMGMFIFGL